MIKLSNYQMIKVPRAGPNYQIIKLSKYQIIKFPRGPVARQYSPGEQKGGDVRWFSAPGGLLAGYRPPWGNHLDVIPGANLGLGFSVSAKPFSLSVYMYIYTYMYPYTYV